MAARTTRQSLTGARPASLQRSPACPSDLSRSRRFASFKLRERQAQRLSVAEQNPAAEHNPSCFGMRPCGCLCATASQCSDLAACAARLNESRNALCGAAPTGNPATHTLKGESRVRTACRRTHPNQERAHEPDHLHRRRHRYRPVHTGILRTPIGPGPSPRRVCPQLCRAAEQSAGHSGEQPQAAIRQTGCAIRHGRLRTKETLIHSHVRYRRPTHASSALPETPLCLSTRVPEVSACLRVRRGPDVAAPRPTGRAGRNGGFASA